MEGELALESGGGGMSGWRKPPASSVVYSGFMTRSGYPAVSLKTIDWRSQGLWKAGYVTNISMVGETLHLGISTPNLKVIGPSHNHF